MMTERTMWKPRSLLLVLLGCVLTLLITLLLHLHPPSQFVPRQYQYFWRAGNEVITTYTNFQTMFERMPLFYETQLNSSSPIQEWEDRIVEQRLWIQLALFSSSRSLAIPDSGPPLADVGTLQNLRTFQPILTLREQAVLMLTFEAFSTACSDKGLSHFLVDNSLVGSLRHHGLIPWSDVSITVAMNREDHQELRNVLDSVKGMHLMEPNLYEWSFYTNMFLPPQSRTPYIKIKFYRQNTTHIIWSSTREDRILYSVERSKVFPLILRPFEGHQTWVPCDVSSVLDINEVRICRVPIDDEGERQSKSGLGSCNVLSEVFPFVAPAAVAAGIQFKEERLQVNGTLLQTVIVPVSC